MDRLRRGVSMLFFTYILSYIWFSLSANAWVIFSFPFIFIQRVIICTTLGHFPNISFIWADFFILNLSTTVATQKRNPQRKLTAHKYPKTKYKEKETERKMSTIISDFGLKKLARSRFMCFWFLDDAEVRSYKFSFEFRHHFSNNILKWLKIMKVTFVHKLWVEIHRLKCRA